ncbi:ATP-binding protein [Candidatus Aerophobetes bacterium]|nr:ATP-binding protein [Candidatus Aerophobetes bacterium]
MGKLKKWIDRREMYAIKGPRQSGKTTLLKMLEQYLIKEKNVNPENIIFLTCEDYEILDKFSRNPKEYVRSFIMGKENERFYFLIDEVQYLPEGGQKLKLLYDVFENIKFIVTGSSSLELTAKTSKFLVGRMFSFYLYPLSFGEFIGVKSRELHNVYGEKSGWVKDFITTGKDFAFPQEDIFSVDFERYFEEYVLFGAYPEVVKTEDVETKRIILKNIYETYITRDIIELLRITDITKFRTLLGILANQISSLVNYNSLAGDIQSYFNQIKHYLSILEETFIINLLKPFFTSKTTELKKNPKLYFMDMGLRNYIIDSFNELALRPDKGKIVENAVFIQLKINEQAPLRYWRTLAKAEVDFIIGDSNNLVPVEVKYSPFKEPKISRGFRNFLSAYKPQRALVFTKGFWGELQIDSCFIKFVPVWYL